MAEVKRIMNRYALENMFNFDETAMYWKMTPDKGLSHDQISGTQKAKVHLTVAPCCSASGTDRQPILLIETAARPLAFRAAGVNTNAMDFQWYHNGSAWMTGAIMELFLRWLNLQMSCQRVLLVMDNFYAHYSAMERY